MGFSKLLYFMLNFLNQSTQTALNRFFSDTDIHISQQAFSKARHKFNHTPFLKLFHAIGDELYSGEYEFETFRGYRVTAIDGSTVALPNTPEMLEYFGGMGVKADSPTARMSIHYDILNDMIIDANIGHISKDERSFAKEHIKRMCEFTKQDKELIIFDRGYSDATLFSELSTQNICFLMRVRRKFNKSIDDAPIGISSIDFPVENTFIPIKVIKFKLSSGEIETLVTNLPENLTIEEFEILYFMRWPIETKYDIVKNKLQIENFSGRTPNAILQDFFATMYLANMAAIAISHANEIVDRERNHKGNKYDYKVNVNQAIGSFKDAFIDACLTGNKKQKAMKINAIISELSLSVVPIRPNRSLPRPNPPRKAKFHHNHKHNC